MNQAIVMVAGAPNPALDQIESYTKKYDQVIYVGIDRGALRLIDRGVRLDLAIGDFDSVSFEEFDRIQQHSHKVGVYPAEKDDTDLELALETMMTKYPSENIPIFIFGALGVTSGARMDHWLSAIMLVHQPRFQSVVGRIQFIESSWRAFVLMPGTHIIPPQPHAKYLSVIGLTAVEGLSIQGAKYNLEKQDLYYPYAYISNEYDDEEVWIELKTGVVLLMDIFIES